MKKIFFINLIGFIIVIGIGELFCRIFFPSLTFEERQKSSIIYRPNPKLGFIPISQKVFITNRGRIFMDSLKFTINDGFRNFNPNSRYDAIILGGSHVFDVNALDCHQNKGFIEEASVKSDFKVANFAVPGYDIRQIDYLIDSIITNNTIKKPIYILISSFWNDLKWITSINNSYSKVPEYHPNPLLLKVLPLDNYFSAFALYRKIRDFYVKKKYHLNLKSNDVLESIQHNKVNNRKFFNGDNGLLFYSNIYSKIIRKCIDHQIIPIIVVEESLYGQNTEKSNKKIDYTLINNINEQELDKLKSNSRSILTTVAKEAHISIFDFNNEFEGKNDYFTDHVHLSEVGSRKLAIKYEELFRTLKNKMPKDLK